MMDKAPSGEEEEDIWQAIGSDSGGLGWLYQVVSGLGMALVTFGAGSELYFKGEMRAGMLPLKEVFGQAWSGEAAAWTTLGIWILIAGPILALISIFVSGLRGRSWSAMGLSGVVLLVIILSVPIKIWLQGGL